MGPQGWRVNVGRGVVVGQFEFPFLAGRGMAGLGDGNRGNDVRSAWLRIGFPRRWVAPVGKIATLSPLVTHGGDGLLRDEKRDCVLRNLFAKIPCDPPTVPPLSRKPSFLSDPVDSARIISAVAEIRAPWCDQGPVAQCRANRSMRRASIPPAPRDRPRPPPRDAPSRFPAPRD